MSRGWGGRRSQRLVGATLAAYGTTCHLCGEPITDLDRTGPRAGWPSADHIVPRSRGGSDALENLRPAHLGCNSSRQAAALKKGGRVVDGRSFFKP